MTFPKFIWNLYSELFFQNLNWFLKCQHFLTTSVVFDDISRILSQEDLEKKFYWVF